MIVSHHKAILGPDEAAACALHYLFTACMDMAAEHMRCYAELLLAGWRIKAFQSL